MKEDLRLTKLTGLIDKYGGQSKLADKVDVSAGFISQIVTGRRPFTEKSARKFEKQLELPLGWFDRDDSSIEPPQSNATFEAGVDSWEAGTPLGEDEIELPFYSEVQLAAGNGFVCDEERITKKLRFSKETLRKSGVDISHAVCVKVEGLSMLPVLPSGSTVGIDSSKKTIHDGDMYAINHKGELRVKLLYNMPGSGVRVRSFNRDEFPDEHYSNIDEAEIHVIGRVFWYSVLC